MVTNKVKVIAKKNGHDLEIGAIVNILRSDKDGTIKVADPDRELTWWLWPSEYELLNQEQ